MGKGGVFIRRGRRLGSGLRTPRSSSHGPYHRRLHGRVCTQESDLLVKKKRGLGKDSFYSSDVCMVDGACASVVKASRKRGTDDSQSRGSCLCWTLFHLFLIPAWMSII